MVVAVLTVLLLGAPADTKVYRRDVRFALDTLEKECERLIKVKGIRWNKVRKQFLKEAKQVKSDADHWLLLWRLVVRLRDGHASVNPTAATKGLKWPAPTLEAGPRMTWFEAKKKVYVKRSWGAARDAGVLAGMEVVAVNGVPAAKWLDARVEELSDLHAWSTDQGGRFFACHWGLGGARGSRLKVELRHPVTQKRKKATLMRTGRGLAPSGPVVFPDGLKAIGRNRYGRLPSGYGYIHLRDVPRSLPADLDKMLAELNDPPGLILDCRANGGGGCDHDAVFGKFVPQGKTLNLSPRKKYRCTSDDPYIGPMVVIVDAGVRSAGETISGIFREDGRAYMIGPAPTAGMSSGKKTIELPSGLFTLYVSVYSNKGRFNRGKGIEGIGVAPHEIVPYDAVELIEGVDTQIRRAEELLKKGFPKNTVPFKAERYGWK